MSLSIWQWLTERHIELDRLSTFGAEVSGVAFHIVQDMEVKSLTPFDICIAADVLELPLNASLRAIAPLSQLSVGILRLLSRRKPLKRAEGTWLAFQIAYLNALREILQQEAQLRRPWLNRARVPLGDYSDAPLSEARLLGLLKTLRPGKLSDSQAEQALARVGESFLVQQLNRVCIAWLAANGAEEMEANLLAQRLVLALPGHLLESIAANAIPLAQLQKFVRLGKLSRAGTELVAGDDTDLAIDLSREQYRARLLKSLGEPLLGEPFALPDLYVPLKGKTLDTSSEDARADPYTLTAKKPAIDLETWADKQLDDSEGIAVIEADPGCGKTSFCRIWAAKVARERYPDWLPVLIPLRNAQLGPTFEQTLESALPLGRFSDADGWLSPQAPPCLLILDGLDELPRSPQKLRHIRLFIDQMMQFHAQRLQQQIAHRHKIVLTTRLGTFSGLVRRQQPGSFSPMQARWQRIIIQALDQEALRQWFKQWSALQSRSISHRYFSFLKEAGVFSRRTPVPAIADLIHQPLLLYLLGLLHRDGLLDTSLFHLQPAAARYEIYTRLTHWLLGEPQGRWRGLDLLKEGLAHASRSPEAIANLLAGRQPQQPRELMQSIALQLLQTDRCLLAAPAPAATEQLANVPALADSAATDYPLPALFFASATRAIPGDPEIAFSHRSFGEYLAAVEIAKQLQAIAQRVQDRYGGTTFHLDSAIAVADHLYRSLSFGFLSADMEVLTIEHLRRAEQRNPKTFTFAALFARLYDFYLAHCQGRWLDEGLAHQTHRYLQTLHSPLNTLQIDAAVGMNSFLLLCAIARAADLAFYPCGDPSNPNEFDADRLLTFIARCSALSPTCFANRLRPNLDRLQLPGACLNQAMLAEANLAAVNLSVAELDRANLAGADLSQADLTWASLVGANLQGADLTNTNMEGANLTGANLHGATLRGANLLNACLYRAQLDSEAEQWARRSGALFKWEEFHIYSQSLAPRVQLNNGSGANFDDDLSEVQIEIAEGEPLPSTVWDAAAVADRPAGPNDVTLAAPDEPPVAGPNDVTFAAPEDVYNGSGLVAPDAETLTDPEGDLSHLPTLADPDADWNDLPTLAALDRDLTADDGQDTIEL